MKSTSTPAAEEAPLFNAVLHRAADMRAEGLLQNTDRIGAEDVSGNRVDVRFSRVDVPMVGER